MAKTITKSIPTPAVRTRVPVTLPPAPVEVKPAGKVYNLPVASVIPNQADMDEVVSLLEQGVEFTNLGKLNDDNLAEVKMRLRELTSKYKLDDGVRHGKYAVMISYSTRSTLDRVKLVENGVTVAQIEASMKPSAVTSIKCVEVTH